MGYMRHHAIIVSSWDDTSILAAHDEAERTFDWVSQISPVVTNGYSSFFIPPDGSKEGWSESDVGDDCRDRFIDYLVQHGRLDWVEVQFGDDNGETVLTRHSVPKKTEPRRRLVRLLRHSDDEQTQESRRQNEQ